MWKCFPSLHLISLWLFSQIFSFFNFLQSLTFFRYRNVYSYHLSHLFRRTSLFMEDKNFVVLNISNFDLFELFWSFSGKTLHWWHYKKVFCWFCHKVWKGKMDLVEKLVTAMYEELPIMTISSFETVSNVKGYHVYQGIWVPKIGKILSSYTLQRQMRCICKEK